MFPQKVMIVGNCLSMAMATACKTYFPAIEVVNLHFEIKDIIGQFKDHADSCDLIIAQLGLDENIYPSDFSEIFDEYSSNNLDRILRFPRIVFSAFHPDCCYAWSRDGAGGIYSPFSYHSAIAVESYRRKYSVDETVSLFNGETFDALGYFDYHEPSMLALEAECKRAGLPADIFPRKWYGQNFMYSINHPKMVVAWDLVEYLMRGAGYKVPALYRERGQPDSFFLGPIWPVYPEIAEKLGVIGDYNFMTSTDFSPNAQHEVHDLRRFVEKCFAHYNTLDFSLVALSQPTTTKFNQIESQLFDQAFERGNRAPQGRKRGAHPYTIVNDRQMWRRAISSVQPGDVDPVGEVPFGISRETKIATAGSCFAQHIAKALERSGYQYLVTEQATAELSTEDAQKSNYGVFSARYGNLYTSRQLLQLIQRAYGEFEPVDIAWQREDGRYVDPFRPQIEPEGYGSIEEVKAAREDHFQAVRDIVEQSDVFVFTLGLTEGWRRRADGAVFPLAPGVAGGRYDQATYEFVNFRASEVTEDLCAAIAEMRKRNSDLRFIFTVSPVPLVATAEPMQNVLTATTYSKSVLRVAAEEVRRMVGGVAYFPSFEVITGNFNRGSYYAEDLRDVRIEGVDHVMRLFFEHFAIDQWSERAVKPARGSDPEMRRRVEAQIHSLYEVVCDEEIIERMSGI